MSLAGIQRRVLRPVFAIVASRLPWHLALIGLFSRFGRREAGLVVVRVVDHIPAVAVMTNLASCIVLEDDPPGLTDPIVAEGP